MLKNMPSSRITTKQLLGDTKDLAKVSAKYKEIEKECPEEGETLIMLKWKIFFLIGLYDRETKLARS